MTDPNQPQPVNPMDLSNPISPLSPMNPNGLTSPWNPIVRAGESQPARAATPDPHAARGRVPAAIALMLGIFALVLSLIPFVDWLAIAAAVGGVALGIVGRRRGVGIAGLVISVVALPLAIVSTVAWTIVFSTPAASTSF